MYDSVKHAKNYIIGDSFFTIQHAGRGKSVLK